MTDFTDASSLHAHLSAQRDGGRTLLATALSWEDTNIMKDSLQAAGFAVDATSLMGMERRLREQTVRLPATLVIGGRLDVRELSGNLASKELDILKDYAQDHPDQLEIVFDTTASISMREQPKPRASRPGI